MLRFFNLMLRKENYKDNEKKQEELREALLHAGAYPMDVREADIKDARNGQVVLETILVTCVETIPGIMYRIKDNNNLSEIEYEGLPTLC